MTEIKPPYHVAPSPPKRPIKLSSDNKGVSEKNIEDNNRKYANKYGIIFEKFSSPNKRSVPDRMLTFPMGLIVFIEYKAPGKRATENQFIDHQKRRANNVLVYVVDDKVVGSKLIDRLLDLDQLDYEFFAKEFVEHQARYTDKNVVEK